MEILRTTRDIFSNPSSVASGPLDLGALREAATPLEAASSGAWSGIATFANGTRRAISWVLPPPVERDDSDHPSAPSQVRFGPIYRDRIRPQGEFLRTLVPLPAFEDCVKVRRAPESFGAGHARKMRGSQGGVAYFGWTRTPPTQVSRTPEPPTSMARSRDGAAHRTKSAGRPGAIVPSARNPIARAPSMVYILRATSGVTASAGAGFAERPPRSVRRPATLIPRQGSRASNGASLDPARRHPAANRLAKG